MVISVARGSNCNLSAFSTFYRLFTSFAFFIFTSNYKKGESTATQRFGSAEGCSRLSAMLPHVYRTSRHEFWYTVFSMVIIFAPFELALHQYLLIHRANHRFSPPFAGACGIFYILHKENPQPIFSLISLGTFIYRIEHDSFL